MITIKTSKGNIQLELDMTNTPKTSENFLNYVRDGFYNETIFHRVIDNFMIQGGGFTETMEQKFAPNTVVNEAKNAKSNLRGTIAMARTPDPHSASAQFFINVRDNLFLNYTNDTAQGFGYCVFGEVVDGMDVVDAILKVKTGSKNGHGDVPLEAVVIHEVIEG